MPKRKITWTKQAIAQLNTAIKYIRINSDQNADVVKEKLLAKINSLADDRTIHRKDHLL